MSVLGTRFEECKVRGKELVEKVSDLIHEGNVRRIILRDEKGNTFMEIPLTIAAVGVIAAPILAAVGGLAALAANYRIVVERTETAEEKTPEPEAAPASKPTEEPPPVAAT
ncbi:MAG: DUF4342 domain-containing protein [Bryobacteraceae bacterium]